MFETAVRGISILSGDTWPVLFFNPLPPFFNSLSSGCPGTCYVAKDELEPLALVPLPAVRAEIAARHHHTVYVLLRIRPTAADVTKALAHWAGN